jgi:hypothetical protein
VGQIISQQTDEQSFKNFELNCWWLPPTSYAWILCWWTVRLNLCAKVLSQRNLATIWLFTWMNSYMSVKGTFGTNSFLHCWHLNNLALLSRKTFCSTELSLFAVIISAWILRCWTARVILCAKDLSQNWQLMGFSPVGTLICLLSIPLPSKLMLLCWDLNNVVFLVTNTFGSTKLSMFVLNPSGCFTL